MFSMLRYLVAALLLAAPAAAVGAETGPLARPGSPADLADWVDQLAPAELGAFQLAQDDAGGSDFDPASDAAVGQQVLEFEFEGQELPREPVPDLLDTEVFNRRVTLDFKNADIQNVIRLIAARTGLNILMNPNEVDGRITLSLDNVPLRDALDNILKVNKLAYVIETGNILRIVPESRVGRGVVETQTIVIELNWRDAKDVQETFKPFLSNHGDIQANEETQTVIVTDVPPNLIKIQDLISQIDNPDRQVIIQARLVDILQGDGQTFSTDWAMRKNRLEGGDQRIVQPGDTFGFNDFGVPGVSVEGVSVAGGTGTLAFGGTIGILGDDYDLDMVLTALENSDIVEVLANPRVTTLNNIPASIEITEEIPWTQAQTNNNTTSFNVQFEKIGVRIDVRPIITPNNFVRLDINLNQRIFRARVGSTAVEADRAALAPPQVDTRTAKSSVIVRDRNTVVIGGLRQIRAGENIDAVPWLNKIPVFGWLFEDRTNEESKANLVLMVTPEVVDEAVLTDVEQELYNRIDDDWDMPDYFLDDLHNMTHAENSYKNTHAH